MPRLQRPWIIARTSWGEIALVSGWAVPAAERKRALPELHVRFELDRWLSDPSTVSSLLEMLKALDGSSFFGGTVPVGQDLHLYLKPRLIEMLRSGRLLALPGPWPEGETFDSRSEPSAPNPPPGARESPPQPPPASSQPTPSAAVTLNLTKPVLTLQHDNQATFRIVVQPASAAASQHRIQIRRAAAGSSWITLANAAVVDGWTAKIAGKFKVRGVAMVDGAERSSPEIDLEVRFPSYAEIVGNGAVQAKLDQEWGATKADCTDSPNQRREHGFWILLNTTSGRYEFGPLVVGAWSGPTSGASVNLPSRPADVPPAPNPTGPGATYPVASFHTHTPTTFRTGMPAGTVRPIGPSEGDNTADATDGVPGVVYDYVESPPGSGSIPMGHPLHSPAKLYRSLGVDRRATPP